MTTNRRVPSEHCLECDGQLLPAESAPDGVFASASADYVCVACRQSYEWVGSPPKLMPAARIPKTRKIETF